MPDLSQRLQQLFARTAAGVKFDLRTVEALLERLNHPERTFASIHIAGTNGKGSVAAMLESVFRAAGFRTGLYTSPHLVRFNERIQVNGIPITDEQLVALFDVIEPLDREAVRSLNRAATFFELTTVMAFEEFRRQQVQLAIVETGMGGRLDATNVVSPEISVITQIGLEHCEFLGHAIEQIAAEKAGIIKPYRPVICGVVDERAETVIRKIAAERRAPFIRAEDNVTVRRVGQNLRSQRIKISTSAAEYPPVEVPLLGRYQLENVITVVATIEYLAQTSKWVADETAVLRGLASVRWPARCQIFEDRPLVVLDVAHNPAAAAALADTLRELAPMKRWALVMGLLADKDAAGFLRAFSSLVDSVWVVPLDTPRAASTEALAVAARQAGFSVTARADVGKACQEAREWAQAHGGAVCIAGSLYLAGEVLRRLEAGEQILGNRRD